MQRYRNREHAGRFLGEVVSDHLDRGGLDASKAVVLALPRGGVPVGVEVARRLGAPLDVFLVRKLGVPGHEEFAMGAIASGGIEVLSKDVLEALRIPERLVQRTGEAEKRELARREQLYRPGPALPLEGRVAIVVDDGLATGSTMHAAVLGVRQHEPAHIVVAVPVGSEEAVGLLEGLGVDVICPLRPSPFEAVGLWYDVFNQTSDEEVRLLLARAAQEREEAQAPGP